MPDLNLFSPPKTRIITGKPWQIVPLLLVLSLGFFGCQQPTTSSKVTTSDSQSTEVQSNITKSLKSEQKTDITANATLIVPGKSVGEITAQTTLADLQRIYGKENVKAGQVPGPEGTTLSGAILFPQDKTRKLTLYWKGASSSVGQASSKTIARNNLPSSLPNTLKVESVIIDEPNSPWHTEEGIKIGTTLKELERLNEHPFTMSGLDWDYGGMILSWGDQGKLREKFQKTGGLGLQLSAPHGYEGNYTAVMGDSTFSSDNPTLQKLNPQVSSISVFLQ